MAAVGRYKMPVFLRNVDVCKLVWKAPADHSVMQILHNPLYAGAYAFGRRAQRTWIVDGRARKATGVRKPRDEWSVLSRDNHQGYISWREYEENHRLLTENAHIEELRSQVSAWRPCPFDGTDAMRSLWPNDARLLRQCKRQGPSLSVPRRRCSRGCRPLYRHWRRQGDRAVAMQILEAVSDRAGPRKRTLRSAVGQSEV